MIYCKIKINNKVFQLLKGVASSACQRSLHYHEDGALVYRRFSNSTRKETLTDDYKILKIYKHITNPSVPQILSALAALAALAVLAALATKNS